MPTLIFFALFHHDRGWENESSWGQIGRYIFFQSAVKGHHIKKIYITILFTVKPLYSEVTGPKQMFTIQRCSPKRGYICSCIHVPEIQCTHTKTVLFLLWDSSGGRAILHDSFWEGRNSKNT